MVGSHWFVYPVEDGIELVIDSTDAEVYERALAEFVNHFLDYDLVDEWTVDGAEVMRFVPAPVNAPAPETAKRNRRSNKVPAPRSAPESAEAC
ncbi:MAG TPA: hypothetical protein VHU88_14320 [Sporichthyaceae bacterium]|jgi:hypothetical protein|nr:hypothetical protein [Sporichthyaceae bacterium]